MKNVIKAALIVILSSSTAYAAGVGQTEGLSTLAILFLVFGAMILVFQLIPGLALFFSMIKGLFAGDQKKSAEAIKIGEEK
jgi:hypothetical protein